MSTLVSSHVQFHIPETAHVLFYKIVAEPDGVRLRIWETASDSDSDTSPYLYILNLRFGTVAAAERYLKAHLALNGGTLVANQDLPAKGKVKLMPHATWTGEER